MPRTAGSALLFALVLLPGCDKINMVQQPRYDTYGQSGIFPDGMVMQHPPEGTIPRERAAYGLPERPELTPALIERGAERYGIYCVPCHAPDGSGNGVVPQRGFPHPPDLRAQRLREAPSSHFYQVITEGYGIMYSYADRVTPRDRWAIAAYIRTLQAAQEPADPALEEG
jgi:mono/diheme cytochrome c family protein